MQLIITDAWLARSRTIQLSGVRLVLGTLVAALLFILLSAGVYHWVFLKGAREGWPVIGTLVRLVVQDEFAQRDRFMRENLDLLARRVGELQGKLTQLESLGERVSGLAGIEPSEIKARPGQGGVLVAGRPLSYDDIDRTLANLIQIADQRSDTLTMLESRLFDQRLRAMMVPTARPLASGDLGSGFGWRVDPISGNGALHTGLDFQAPPGTPILAAAGGVVLTQEYHPAYGNLVEIDHGNALVTRYAHASRVLVRAGEVVRRGQHIADVGSTGRSTGPHLHFEVLVGGVPQDPQRFLDAGSSISSSRTAMAGARGQPRPPQR